MRNARKYNTRITIGAVPGRDDLLQLQALGYRTMVDLRDEEEKGAGQVECWATDLDLRYVSIPILREAITLDAATHFYDLVFTRDTAPLYLFSRFGKRPLALLLLFEAAVKDEPLALIYQNASEFGLDLEGDLCLRGFLVEFYNERRLQPVIETYRSRRPDLF